MNSTHTTARPRFTGHDALEWMVTATGMTEADVLSTELLSDSGSTPIYSHDDLLAVQAEMIRGLPAAGMSHTDLLGRFHRLTTYKHLDATECTEMLQLCNEILARGGYDMVTLLAAG